MARSKLTPTMLDKLEQACDDTWGIKDACNKIGINEATWYRWEANPKDTPEHHRFRELAARVRAGRDEKVNELCWGALREILDNPEARPSDKVAAALGIMRLRTAHRVEHSGPQGKPIEVQVDLAQRINEYAGAIDEIIDAEGSLGQGE